ncbi:MAG TPA: OB-fold nucleic acid binding domain-containing protein, partial [Caulobacteraceae bacterium]
LKNVLKKTFGVPLFQEQAMRIAMEAAEFTGDEANGLRRAMATFRHNGTIGLYEEKMVSRMIARGYPPEFANNCFSQIKGFGEYGFPESHAVSFGRLVYISAWMKCFWPEVFAAALLNSQPMGFYAPAQIVRDAREHGVEVRHPDVNASAWDCTLEGDTSGGIEGRNSEGIERRTSPLLPKIRGHRSGGILPLRLGLRQISGFRREWAEALVKAREAGAFASLEDLRRRAGLPGKALDMLADADALNSLELGRRPGLWAARGLPKASDSVAPAPLFVAAGIEEADGPPPAALPATTASEEVVNDYQSIRLSLKGHPMAFLRERYAAEGAVTAQALAEVKDGRRSAVAGVVLVRQRPGSAKGVVFLTIEDETGSANLVVWPDVFEAFRPVVMGARLVLIRGKVQRSEGVTHLVVETIEDRTGDLASLSDTPLNPQTIPGDEAARARPGRQDSGSRRGSQADDAPVPAPKQNTSHKPFTKPMPGAVGHVHPRDVRIMPRSRDFH